MTDLTWFLVAIVTVVSFIALFRMSKKTVFSSSVGQNRKPIPRLPLGLLGLMKAALDPRTDFVQVFARLGQIDPLHSIFLWWPEIKIVIINDLEFAKELFCSSIGSGRPETPMWQYNAKGNYGIATSTGKVWVEQRKFSFATLKEAGLGNKSIEKLIEFEVEEFIQGLKVHEGKAFAPRKMTSVHLLNTLWVLLTGERFIPGENESNEMLASIYEGFTNTMKYPQVLLLATNFKIETVDLIKKFFPFWKSAANSREGMDKLREFCQNLIEKQKQKKEQREQMKNFDQNFNFIDTYLEEIDKAQDNTKSTFHKEIGIMNLIATCEDLFIAGGETAATLICWSMLHLVRNPQVQLKIHEELDRVVGKERRPTLNDRPKCSYLEAFIYEVMRFTPASILTLPHMTTEDVTIRDHFIEKGTTMVLNIAGVHFDPRIWENPEKFEPSRFISEIDGTLEKNEGMVVFGVGKRKCPGYQFGLDNLFLFTSAMCQSFHFKKDPKLGDKLPLLISDASAMNTPKEFSIVVENRI